MPKKKPKHKFIPANVFGDLLARMISAYRKAYREMDKPYAENLADFDKPSKPKKKPKGRNGR